MRLGTVAKPESAAPVSLQKAFTAHVSHCNRTIKDCRHPMVSCLALTVRFMSWAMMYNSCFLHAWHDIEPDVPHKQRQSTSPVVLLDDEAAGVPSSGLGRCAQQHAVPQGHDVGSADSLEGSCSRRARQDGFQRQRTSGVHCVRHPADSLALLHHIPWIASDHFSFHTERVLNGL